MNITDWIPHRDRGHSNKWRCYQSRNFRVFLSLKGDIYAFHLSVGPLAVCWESRELRSRGKNFRKKS